MDTYLLLRSNKQSGPYSLQQLVNFGLKPYDLVWVEGKSAAWRYPSEVEGLKNYAPATEEQPFDRFYKKAEAAPINKPVPQKEDVRVEPKEEVYIQPMEKTLLLHAENKTVATKKVYVSMPGGQAAKRPASIQTKPPVMVEEKPVIVEEKRIGSYPKPEHEEPVIKQIPVLPKQEPVFKAPTISAKEEPTLNEKYSESLDDIKRRYTETYLKRKKRSKWTSTHTSLVQVFGGAIFFCFLVVVAYKNFSGEETQAKTTIQPNRRSINTTSTTIPVNTPAVTPPVVAETNKQSGKKSPTQRTQLDPQDESSYTIASQQKTDDLIKENQIAEAAYKPVKKTEVTDEQKPEEVKPKPRPVNINRLVNVRANNYKQRAFGGVMNLQLTVNNDSKFEIDKVVVELQYLKPSEEPIKTEKIVFSSIAPNDSKTLKIPDYLRGVKVAYRVIDVESSQYERQTAGL